MSQAEEMLRAKYHQGHPKFFDLTLEELALHDKKNADYAKGGDPLGNFKRVSAILAIWGFDVPPELVALIYALKQQDCAMWQLSQGYEGQIEDFDKRAEDVHVYWKLARILHGEENKKEVVPKDYQPVGVLGFDIP